MLKRLFGHMEKPVWGYDIAFSATRHACHTKPDSMKKHCGRAYIRK